MKRLVWSAIASLVLAAPLAVHAADGYVTGNVNLRAGPDVEYPLVDTIPAGSAISIQGCTSGWEWCDVIASGNRGWVAGNFIQYEYQNQRVLLPAYGARIGIPVVSFVIGTYWNDYYRSRPFYSQRNTWFNRPVPHRPPPAPRPTLAPPAHRPPVHGSRPAAHRPPAVHAPAHRPGPQPRPAATRPPARTPVSAWAAPTSRPKPAGTRPTAPKGRVAHPAPKKTNDNGGN